MRRGWTPALRKMARSMGGKREFWCCGRAARYFSKNSRQGGAAPPGPQGKEVGTRVREMPEHLTLVLIVRLPFSGSPREESYQVGAGGSPDPLSRRMAVRERRRGIAE